MKKRIFFALLPDDIALTAIIHEIENIKSASTYSSEHSTHSWVKTQNIHLTLSFIGQTETSTINYLIKEAKKINLTAFKFSLECTGYFENARALWLGLREPNNDLQALKNSINDIIASCDIPVETEPFIPHVTIARKFKNEHKPYFYEKIEWQVKNYYLMESVSGQNGVEYKIIHQF